MGGMRRRCNPIPPTQLTQRKLLRGPRIGWLGEVIIPPSQLIPTSMMPPPPHTHSFSRLPHRLPRSLNLPLYPRMLFFPITSCP